MRVRFEKYSPGSIKLHRIRIIESNTTRNIVLFSILFYISLSKHMYTKELLSNSYESENMTETFLTPITY